MPLLVRLSLLANRSEESNRQMWDCRLQAYTQSTFSKRRFGIPSKQAAFSFRWPIFVACEGIPWADQRLRATIMDK